MQSLARISVKERREGKGYATCSVSMMTLSRAIFFSCFYIRSWFMSKEWTVSTGVVILCLGGGWVVALVLYISNSEVCSVLIGEPTLSLSLSIGSSESKGNVNN